MLKPTKRLSVAAFLVLALVSSLPARGSFIVSSDNATWPNGRIPYWLPPSEFPAGSKEAMEIAKLIRAAVSSWNDQVGCAVRLEELVSQEEPKGSYLRWERSRPSEPSSAPIGFQPVKANTVRVGTDCLRLPCILHLIAHSVGLAHEHQRCERNPYIQFRSEALPKQVNSVFPEVTGLFSRVWAEPEWKPICVGSRLIPYGDYDFASIMHYGSNELVAGNAPRWDPTERGKLRLKEMGLESFEVGLRALSYGDLEAIKHLYKKTAICEPTYACPLPTTGDQRPYLRPIDDIAPDGGGVFLAKRGSGATQHLHGALDLNSKPSAPVYAIRKGIIEIAQTNWQPRGFGSAVVINHGDGLYSAYGHLSFIEPTLKKGTTVKAGDFIGRVGYTGNASGIEKCGLPPHLHLEVIYSGATGKAPASGPVQTLKKLGESWSIECANLAQACLGEFIIDSKNVDAGKDWALGDVNPAILLDGLNCWDKQPQPMRGCPPKSP